jgi:hypothetical protein
MRHELFFFTWLVAAPLSFAASLPEASPAPTSELSPVMVSRSTGIPPVRLDVRTACPGIDASLQRTLSAAWGRVQESATMRVQFRVDAGRVTEVRPTASSGDYRPLVRRAVQQLACPMAGTQAFAFMLDIHGPDSTADSQRVAVLDAGN